MQTASAKAKGRSGQQEVCHQALHKEALKLQEGDLTSRPMGSQGDDIIVSPYGLKQLYFGGWEVKRRSRISICRWFEQVLHRKRSNPIVCFREDRGEWFCMARLSDILELLAIRAKAQGESI